VRRGLRSACFAIGTPRHRYGMTTSVQDHHATGQSARSKVTTGRVPPLIRSSHGRAKTLNAAKPSGRKWVKKRGLTLCCGRFSHVAEVLKSAQQMSLGGRLNDASAPLPDSRHCKNEMNGEAIAHHPDITTSTAARAGKRHRACGQCGK
jgi:hypothetical protein